VKILITGVSGGLAGLVADRLVEEGHELVGADVRSLPPGRAFTGEFYQVRRYDQRRMAEVFRQHQPEVLVHLGRVRGTAMRSLHHRYTLNVLGTRNLLKLALKNGVRRVVVMSTFHVYGAHQHNHVLIREDHPLRASQIFPELNDAVELDHAATSFLWRYRRVETVVLRPVNMIGPNLNNMISRQLRMRAVPRLLGYDPMMQFMHERDAAKAIMLAIGSGRWGVYNVSGEGVVPYSEAIRLVGGTPVPIPHVLAYPMVDRLSRFRLLFPKHLMDYFRYPTVIDDRLFREELGYEPEFSTVETLRSLRRGPAPGPA
jgi:UDP-glucose 4-epimerase